MVTASPDDAKVMNQIRKWGCHFDGGDTLAFFERIQELNAGYNYSGELLLKGLSELLKRDVLLWYRNYRERWRGWGDFEDGLRRQYLPRRYRAVLRQEILERRQKPTGTFAHYASVMMTLMRRTSGFDPEEQFERIYSNMCSEYKMYVRIDDVKDLDELGDQASKYEEIRQENAREQQRDKMTAGKPIVAAAYNRAECCWRCKQRGHTRFECKRPAKKCCSQCGRDGVLMSQCRRETRKGPRPHWPPLVPTMQRSKVHSAAPPDHPDTPPTIHCVTRHRIRDLFCKHRDRQRRPRSGVQTPIGPRPNPAGRQLVCRHPRDYHRTACGPGAHPPARVLGTTHARQRDLNRRRSMGQTTDHHSTTVEHAARITA